MNRTKAIFLVTILAATAVGVATWAQTTAPSGGTQNRNFNSDQNNNQRNELRAQRRRDRQARGGSATTNPDAQDDVAPIVIPEPQQMTRDFALLGDRNIFVRGIERADSNNNGNGQSDPDAISAALARVLHQESVLVFNGVGVSDGAPVAFLWDTDGDQEQAYKIGDAVARGKVSDITLDSMDYIANGSTVRVFIGHNLQGVNIWAPTTEPTTGPSGADMSVLDRLRARRAAEQKALGN